MRMVDIIEKKRDGLNLTKDEIDFAIEGYTNGTIPDYQMSALAMAIYFNDMTKEERAHLTMAILNSGDQIDLSAIKGIKVDKHSTGGVGDKTTLVLTPLVAACGVPVAKMSGRGLGHTGGTLDKLESIPGFNIHISEEDFVKQVNEKKIAVIGQTANLTPADKFLYALRDVTATVDSIPLIASSIMSKKLASGADAIVLDVKVGQGSFMKTIEDAKELATAMVEIGNSLDRETVAFLTNMDEPLGFAVGNTLEVLEAIETLKGNGPSDLLELCLSIGSQMLKLAQVTDDLDVAREMLIEKINNGEALNKLFDLFIAQGANESIIEDVYNLPKANEVIEVKANMDGYVGSINALDIGHAAMLLGAGRLTKEDHIDLAVGVVLNKKVGDTVCVNEPLAYIHTNGLKTEEAIEYVSRAYQLSTDPIQPHTLIYGTVTES